MLAPPGTLAPWAPGHSELEQGLNGAAVSATQTLLGPGCLQSLALWPPRTRAESALCLQAPRHFQFILPGFCP